MPSAGRYAAGAAISVVGALAMSSTVDALLAQARQGLGTDAMMAWVLVLLAGGGALLCAYLALVWGLASLVAVTGPASTAGRTLLVALRLLAPRLARRVAVGASAATVAGSLMLLPASAAVEDVFENPSASSASAAQSIAADGTDTDDGPALPDPAAPEEGSLPTLDEIPRQELPDLGWEGTPVPIPEEAADAPSSDDQDPHADQDSQNAQQATDAGEAAEAAGTYAEDTGAPAPPPGTVVVEQGDTLWSITDDLLGPDADADADITAAWPDLHQANRDLLGDDPSLLIPGQVLTVPGHLTTQEQS
ncbi:LysM peptidoglycan-binding domain-containing protein [Brachybacterium sp. DNPG3]